MFLMARKAIEVFDEFCNRLEEPGSLIWKEEWEDALYNERFTDYANILSKADSLPSLKEALNSEEKFRGFVNLNDFDFKMQKRNLNALHSTLVGFNAEFGYFKDDFFKYVQTKEKNKSGLIHNISFFNENFYTQRIYSQAKVNYSQLFYFANYALFDIQGYHIRFSQYDPDVFNIYLTKKGKNLPFIKFEMDSSWKRSKELINNSHIFNDFETFFNLMKNKKCMLFEEPVKGKLISSGGSIRDNALVLEFGKALELL
jgi:hypothetical protein